MSSASSSWLILRVEWAAHSICARWHVRMWLRRILNKLRASHFGAVISEHCHRSHVASFVHLTAGDMQHRRHGVQLQSRTL